MTTVDYTGVTPVASVRLSSEPVYQRLKANASARRQAISSLAERLIDEGLRMDAHPACVRDGPTGRRPALETSA